MIRGYEVLSSVAGSRLREFGKGLFRTHTDPETLPSPERIEANSPTLYIHVPFCRPPLCEMCPFCRQEFNKSKAERYMNDLGVELARYKHLNFSSVYIGGGTPATVIGELMQLLGGVGIGAEKLSVEAHPADLTPRNIEAMLGGGVTRLSVGVQSFDKDLLEQMGRNNGRNPVEHLKQAQQYFEVNADLIYNFAGQTIAQFMNDLDTLINEIGVSQITCYPLMAAPGTFSQVDDSKQNLYYRAMRDKLKSAGYSPLTPWCFTKSEAEGQGEYISSAGGDQYVGVGVSSISKIGSTFTINTFDLDEYHHSVSQNHRPVVGVRHLNSIEDAEYFLLTNLFGMRLDVNKLTGNRIKDALIRTELQALRALGLITIKNQTAELTEEGMFFFSQVMKDFYTGLNFYRDQLKK